MIKPTFRYRSHLIALTALCFIPVQPGCAAEQSNCDAATDGDFAIQVLIYDAPDCNYSGYVVREDESLDVKQDMTCETIDSICTCIGGDDFGVYDVYLKDGATGQIQHGKISAEISPPPECVERDTLDRFVVIDDDPDNDGGAGGAD